MTPPGSAGPEGSPDYQRVSNWDGPVLTSHVGGSVTGIQTLGPFNVSRYGYLSGYLSGENVGNAADVEYRLEWSDEETFNHIIGERRITIPSGQEAFTQLRIPNMGPFLRVTTKALTELTVYKPEYRLAGSNRYSPIELIPRQPYLVLRKIEAFAAKANKLYRFQSGFAGPFTAWVFTAGAVTAVALEYLTQPNVWELGTQLEPTTAPQSNSLSYIAPFAYCRINLQNVDASEKQLQICVLPSTTGAH